MAGDARGRGLWGVVHVDAGRRMRNAEWKTHPLYNSIQSQSPAQVLITDF